MTARNMGGVSRTPRSMPRASFFEMLEARQMLTVLTFDTGSLNGAPLDNNYGDLVAAASQNGFTYGTAGGFTPNVSVSYQRDGGRVENWDQYGGLENVIYGEGGTGITRITLSADAGYQVVLGSMNLAEYGMFDETINSVEVLDGGGQVLYHAGNVVVSDASTRISFPRGLQSRTLQIRIDASNRGGQSDNIGIDNIQFAQVTGGADDRRPLKGPLYVITHGFQFENVAPDWVFDMAAAIANRTGIVRHGKDIGHSDVSFDPSVAPEAGNNPNFLIFDWAAVSRDLGVANEDEVAGALASRIYDRLLALGKADIHFIGHSRGSYVNAEAIRRLADLGLSGRMGFVQMTTLDPQAEGFDGTLEANPGGVVDWADNYYQNAGSPEGKPIDGALNIDLTSIVKSWGYRNGAGKWGPKNHQEVHDWYHWTIDRAQTTDYGSMPEVTPQVRKQMFAAGQIKVDGGIADLDKDGLVDDFDLGGRVGFFYSLGGALGLHLPKKLSGLDLIFAIDLSGSMSDDIAAIKSSAAQIVNGIKNELADVRIGIAGYRSVEGTGLPAQTVLGLTENTGAVISHIDSLYASGGNTVGESVYSGLAWAMSLRKGLGTWRGGNVRRAIVLIGDERPQNPEPVTGMTAYSTLIRAANTGVDIYTINAGNSSDVGKAFSVLAEGSGGKSFGATTGQAVVDAVIETAREAAPATPPSWKAISVPDLDARGWASHELVIKFADDVAIDVSTLDDYDLRVTSKKGFAPLVKFASVDVDSDGAVRYARYRVMPPSATEWGWSHNDLYTVTLRVGQVADTAGTAVPAGTIGQFGVAIPEARSEATDMAGFLAGHKSVKGYVNIPVTLTRVDVKGATIQPNTPTFVVIHGRISSASESNIKDLADALAKFEPGSYQVLTLDWKLGAADNSGKLTLEGSKWIAGVAEAAARLIHGQGIRSEQLNLVGHSWGSIVANEIAREQVSNGRYKVSSIVALDPAGLGGRYLLNPVKFKEHSRFSWGLNSSVFLGSDALAKTAHETFNVKVSAGVVESHSNVIPLFASLVRLNSAGSVPDPVSSLFSIRRILSDPVAAALWQEPKSDWTAHIEAAPAPKGHPLHVSDNTLVEWVPVSAAYLPVGKKTLRVERWPEDNAGNTWDTAAPVTLTGDEVTLSGWVGFRDMDDYFSLEVPMQRTFTATLFGLGDDANLKVGRYTAGDPVFIPSATVLGVNNETVAGKLKVGRYFFHARARDIDANTFYQLKIVLT